MSLFKKKNSFLRIYDHYYVTFHVINWMNFNLYFLSKFPSNSPLKLLLQIYIIYDTVVWEILANICGGGAKRPPLDVNIDQHPLLIRELMIMLFFVCKISDNECDIDKEPQVASRQSSHTRCSVGER